MTVASNMRRVALFSALFLLLLAACAQAKPHSGASWQARVVDVADGDTLTAEPLQGGERIKIRLYGVDTPERRQPYGEKARGFVHNAALFKQVTVRPADQGRDRYGRTVAVIEIPGAGVLQEMLLKEGLAWVYTQYCKSCSAWREMERTAKTGRKGLWADDAPVPPWEWRRAARK